jgi:hypothetical protein
LKPTEEQKQLTFHYFFIGVLKKRAESASGSVLQRLAKEQRKKNMFCIKKGCTTKVTGVNLR